MKSVKEMHAMTVLGPVAAEELGTTLIHEHLLFDFRDYLETPQTAGEAQLATQPLSMPLLGRLRYRPFLLADNLLHGDEALAIAEIAAFAARGGRTVVDPTNASLGRDPAALQRIARATGLQIVMGCGYYTEISLGPAFAARSVDDVTAELIREVRDGVPVDGVSIDGVPVDGAIGGPVRAGLIGEIGTSAPITANEQRSLTAAARAQAATGAPLMIHLDGWGREGGRVLDLVAAEGAALERVILCHLNPSCHDLDYQRSLAERGAYLEYDMMGMTNVYPPAKVCPDDGAALAALAQLMRDGFRDRLLISQDVFMKMMLRRYGGLGYTHLFDNLPPLYRAAGIDDEDLHAMLVANPARVLAFLEA